MSDYLNELNMRAEAAIATCQTARRRILTLFDEGTFMETGMFVKQRGTDFIAEKLDAPSDGVVCGSGYVDGRLIYAYSQDNSVLGGSIGEMHAKKIKETYDGAVKMGAPIVAIIDSKGMRLNENVDALAAFGTVFKSMSRASGVIPQISVILGDCGGGLSFIPALSDFVFMTEKDALLFLTSPNSIPGDEGRLVSLPEHGGGKAHAEKSGLCDFVCADEDAVFISLKKLLGFLPSNNMDEGVVFPTEQSPSRKCPTLDDMCETDKIDAYEVIKAISDSGDFVEANKDFAKSIVTGFARFNGFTAGIVANAKEGLICAKCMGKAASFVNFCDSFNIPVVTLTNVNGFKPLPIAEQAVLIRSAASLMHAFCAATVPKINVIVGNAFGTAYVVMNSKHLGADAVYAWANAKISVMSADAAVNIMLADEIKSADNSIAFRDEKIKQYDEFQASPYTAAGRGYVDAVIAPSETRNVISSAIEALSSKRVLSPSRKHSSF